ncbi:MAG: 23S rRNA (uracil(1939)-C(5))-methyltransferase RlmD [Candidatus Izemoplasmataceae bacterium]|jgi:23S rRNA (uracil1939-C5)-methyltransferase|uniref:23S rRNA (uracil(1939)-C(5))-methyltransferase RlmD n=1 Tax=Liberiplasma polymorphum TaxID=3374570 RepID=UPI003772AB92
MVDKNAYYEVEFTDLTHDAMGVCKVDGYPIFVKDALKGEKALIKVIKMNKNFGFGRLVDIRQESPFRKLPICEHYQVCGGCNTMHMNYQTQLDFKKYRTAETLKKLGHIETTVHDTVGMSNPYYYRNKAIIPFAVKNGKIVAGLYKQRSHDIVNIKRCHVFPKIVSDMVRFLKALFTEFEIPIYDELIHEGFLRAVMFRHSFTKDEYSMTFITTSAKFPQKDEILRAINSKYPMVISIMQNINSEQTNVLLGDKSKVLYGKDLLEDELLGLKFEISHKSFYQINPQQTALLYEKAIEYAKLKSTDTIVDAYCGIGTIGLTAAKYVKEVIGMDTIKDAIKNAQQNAKNNNIKNAKYMVGAAEDILPTLTDKKIDVLFIDPPRKGCERKFLEAIIKMKIPRVVYISCNVSTLARDLNFLQANRYQVKEVTPFDMFPQTSHIESVTMLEFK